MPLDPNTGLYSDPQGSLFPNGTFGGALKIGNASIARELANEAAARRALSDHMNELQVEDAELKLADDAVLRQRRDDEFTRGESWRNWISEHPQATTTEKLNAAMSFGQKDVKHLTDLVQSEATDAFKKDKLDRETNVDFMAEARKEATELLSQGHKGSDVAELLRNKYGNKIPTLYYDKLGMIGASPLASATINARNARAGVDNARVAGTLPAPASATRTDPEAKLLKEKDRLLKIAAATKAQIADERGEVPDSVKEIAKIRLNQAEMQIEKVERELADLRGRQAGRTPPPIEDSVDVKPPKFKPFPAPGKEVGKTATVTLKDGTLESAVVKMIDGNPFWVPLN